MGSRSRFLPAVRWKLLVRNRYKSSRCSSIALTWRISGSRPKRPQSGKPYTELGDLTYTEPFTPDAIDEAKISDKLKAMAFAKWPDTIDAIVNENQTTSADGSQITVTAKAIKYDSSVDREALHHMNEGMVASPNGN